MFERFTDGARHHVVISLEQSRSRDDRHVGTEHMLLSMCAGTTETALAAAFKRQGITLKSITSVLARATTAAEGVAQDRDSLSVLGIDIEAIQDATDIAFGHGALDRARDSNHTRRRRFGRKRTQGHQSSHVPFTSGAKAAFEDSLRIALKRKDSYICGAHLALAIVATTEGPAHDVLTAPDLGVDLDQLRNDLTACIADR